SESKESSSTPAAYRSSTCSRSTRSTCAGSVDDICLDLPPLSANRQPPCRSQPIIPPADPPPPPPEAPALTECRGGTDRSPVGSCHQEGRPWQCPRIGCHVPGRPKRSTPRGPGTRGWSLKAVRTLRRRSREQRHRRLLALPREDFRALTYSRARVGR